MHQKNIIDHRYIRFFLMYITSSTASENVKTSLLYSLFNNASCVTNNKFIIFSYSLLVLKAMNHTSPKNPQIQKLLEKCHELLANKEIVLCWIPNHTSIQGNEMVEQQAKTSLSLEPTSFKILFSNFKPSINKYILEE